MMEAIVYQFRSTYFTIGELVVSDRDGRRIPLYLVYTT